MITSNSNDKVKEIEKLGKQSRLRKEQGVFLVEGIRMFREVLPEKIVEIYYTKEAIDKYSELSGELDAARPYAERIEEVTDGVMKKMSGTETPQGILAVVRADYYSVKDLTECVGNEHESMPFLLILERIQDPGNLGTIIRMAEGAGVTGILLSSDSADHYSPKVVRSTMGSVLRMKIAVSENIAQDVRLLKEKGVTVFGTHLSGKDFYDEDFRGASAFLIGNEGRGLSDELSGEADKLIRIPMMGSVESLNAAVSASVVSYEVLRQRRG